MTLLIALKWILEGEEGIVVSSDSKATVGPVSYKTRKVCPITLKVGKLKRGGSKLWGMP